jgi:polar amino acid transport system ATP-binding protein
MQMGFAAKSPDRVLFLADGCIEEQEHRATVHQPKSPRLKYFLSSWSELPVGG